MIFVHRVVRLYPLLLLTLGVFCFVVPTINDGPIYYRIYQMINEYCGKIWPLVLTFTINFRKWGQNCLDNTWYIAIDFQLFILAVFIVYIYSKKKLIGILIPVVIIISCAVTTTIIAFKYDIWASLNKYNHDYEEKFYEKPYTRAGTYMLGILAGYFFYEYKAGNLVGFTSAIRNSIVLRFICHIVGLGGMIGLLQVLYFINKELPPRVLDLLYLLFSRLTFIFLLFLFTLPVLLGKSSWISALFGNYPFFVLGRLSYGAYMVQQIPMNYYAFMKRRGTFFSFSHLSMNSWGYFFMAFFGAFLTFLFFEQPIYSLEQTFLLKKKPKKKLQEVEEDYENTKMLELKPDKES
eukprot:TRINITY_DN7874_c0_g4_i2.p1 TRINITY_DN7874_c0_g4~~TRINITY_DN7874_c0_g4_i2.p1  ORF type:complete len:350 (+),score=83.20 TRINITY_DN7874_c0_g4_i2:162-1211(+)